MVEKIKEVVELLKPCGGRDFHQPQQSIDL
jgi:hypothetical protein